MSLENFDGYGEEFKGGPKSPPTPKQKEILKFIKETLGIRPSGKPTSKKAWEFINEYYDEALQIKDLMDQEENNA